MAGTVARAQALFARGFNCAESTFAALAAAQGVDDPLVPRVATAFGGGVARQGLTCGALLGACLALGMRYGRTRPDASRTPTYRRVRRLMTRFRQRFGSTDCSTLIGFDMSDPVQQRAALASDVHARLCPRYIAHAVRSCRQLTR